MTITFEQTEKNIVNPEYVDIEYQKKKIGHIAKTKKGRWEITLATKREKDEISSIPFDLITFKTQFLNVKNAKKFLKNNEEIIFEMYDIYQFEGNEGKTLKDLYYMVIDKNKIPECCGSCINMRMIDNTSKCGLTGIETSLFSICDSFHLNEIIFEKRIIRK
ncbi:MAG: hypothetical protein WC516_09390 [Patescibacteria group bacterium]|jgi:hypothetical protein